MILRINPIYDFYGIFLYGYFQAKNPDYESNYFSPDEVDDMQSLLHITGIGDYLNQLIIPSHK